MDHLSLAATSTSVALAWTETDGGSAGKGYVALLSADLGVKTILGPLGPAGLRRARIVPSDGGWTVAYDDVASKQILIFHVDASGGVTNAASFTNAFDPLLVEGPDGSLLAWQGGGTTELYLAVLSPKGAVVTSTVVPSFQVTEWDFGGGVFVDGGWLVAQRGPSGVSYVRFAGGTLSTKSPFGGSTEYPTITADGGEIRVTFNEFGGNPATVRYGRIDSAGNALGPSVAIAKAPAQFNEAPIVSAGGLSWVLLGGYTGQTGVGQSLDLLTLDAAGNALGAPLPLVREPSTRQYRIARRGPELVVAWVGGSCGSTVGLLRLLP